MQLKKDQALRDKFMVVWSLLTACPPAALAVHMLVNNIRPGSLEKATIASCFFSILRQLLSTSIDNEKVCGCHCLGYGAII